MLFQAEQIQEIDQFFDLVRRVGVNPNPSGTAPTLIGLGVGGLFIAPEVFSGDWETAGSRVKQVGAIMLSGSLASRLLYTPTGAKLLRTGLVMNVAEPGAKEIARLLAVTTVRASQEESRKQAEDLPLGWNLKTAR